MEIRSYTELKQSISDIKSLYKEELGNWFIDLLFNRPARKIYNYIYFTRCLEYYDRKNSLISLVLRAYYYYRRIRLSYQLGYQIPPHTCGKNLRLVHWGMIVVNSQASIGNNVTIYPGVLIGSTPTGVPKIGNHVWIGAGSKVFGGITIGSNVIISPNTVVNKSVDDNSIVGGCPVRVLKKIDENEFERYSDYLGIINYNLVNER